MSFPLHVTSVLKNYYRASSLGTFISGKYAQIIIRTFVTEMFKCINRSMLFTFVRIYHLSTELQDLEGDSNHPLTVYYIVGFATNTDMFNNLRQPKLSLI